MIRWDTGSALQRRVALAVIAVLAVNPSATVAGGGPLEAAARPAAAVRAGSLVVESEPAGASAYVDGRLRGQTPLTLASFPAGDHRIRLVKSGYLEHARVVSVGATPSTVRVRLTRDAGSGQEVPSGQGSSGGSRWPQLLAAAGVGAAVAAALLLKRADSPSSSVTQAPPPETPEPPPVTQPPPPVIPPPPPPPVNRAPTIGSLTASPSTAIVATITTFAAVNASDPDGDPLTFTWDFGDGGTGTGAATIHTYATAGTRAVTVTVSDGSSSASATGGLVVKSLTSAWAGLPTGWSPSPGGVTLTQSNTAIGGTFSDGTNVGNIAGTVNATSRVVNFTVTFTIPATGPQMMFSGTPNADATTLTGTCTNIFETLCSPSLAWVLTRP